jgi:hypothetical protein
MNTSNSIPPVPSEFDDEVDDASLLPGYVWTYPCKLSSCPDYDKSWVLRSKFLLHLQEQHAHATTAKTAAGRRTVELEWRYTVPHLPPRAAPDSRSREDPDEDIWNYSFRDNNGNIIDGKGTMKQAKTHMVSRRQQLQRTGSA